MYNRDDERIIGTFIGHEKGFGFVEVEGSDEDYYIPKSNTKGALHLDEVAIIPNRVQTGKRKEAQVVKILSHGIDEVVGFYQPNKNFGYVLPDNKKINKDIYVKGKNSKGAVKGHKVIVRIIDYGKEGTKPEGVVQEILGHVTDPGVDIMSIVKEYNIPTDFNYGVMEEADSIPQKVPEKDIQNRLDFRNIQTVTIDGEDAKDLDDAVTISKDGDIYTLGVHIADVSHYVTEGSALDEEAIDRGTSVYLVDRVIPMLPRKLSNGICSLNEGEDRLTLSCIMKIDAKGNIIEHEIAESVINVDRRMSYTEVQAVNDGYGDAISRNEGFVEMFNLMLELSEILRAKREERGSIDFDTKESSIEIGEDGKVISVEAYERNRATKIIEDFMLAANETVAEHFYWMESPFVYRNHAEPDPEKMKELSLFVGGFGYSIHSNSGQVYPKELQKMLNKSADTPQAALIHRVTLRSMQRAIYEPVNKGHYGLAAKYYCHFTSPIRRYPDLQIHRIIKEHLKGEFDESRASHYNKILPEIAKQSSMAERVADDAERDVEKMKKAEFMREHLGDTFEGIISGVTNFGIYVELYNTIEGLVHVSTMSDDHYEFDETNYELVGEKTGKIYKLGQQVEIRVDSASKVSRTIDFSLI